MYTGIYYTTRKCQENCETNQFKVNVYTCVVRKKTYEFGSDSTKNSATSLTKIGKILKMYQYFVLCTKLCVAE